MSLTTVIIADSYVVSRVPSGVFPVEMASLSTTFQPRKRTETSFRKANQLIGNNIVVAHGNLSIVLGEIQRMPV